MNAVRHLLAQRHLAVLLCAATLLLKLLVPTGYMIASDHGRLSITICSGMATEPTAMATPGMDHAMTMAHGTMPDTDKSTGHAKPEMPCAFAGLSAQVLGAVDVVLLAIALAAVAIMALRSVPRLAPRTASYLRPPLRGPPLSA
ncbi:DUF2946 family protein [Sphingomonas panni]|uniref:DUF2946 family protein n=1 Tax=Sphingomonas panni TaxID=237612 RepID=UPI001F5B83A1